MKRLMTFVKKEVVLTVAFVLAVVSAFFVFPDKAYIDYIDFKTLSLLFCLMGVMAGLQKIGVFKFIAGRLLEKVSSPRMLLFILVGLCFFFSMFITNDVALITFVPFTFMVLSLLGEEVKQRLAVPIVLLQTIAANLGSMFTPIGNPQNLYLYSKAEMSLGEFLKVMGPYTAVSFVCIALAALFFGRREKEAVCVEMEQGKISGSKLMMIVYCLLFLLALSTVLRLVPYYVTLAVTAVVLLVLDKAIFAKIDYSLLATFVCFFIFIGNMGRLPAFHDLLERVVAGNEVYCGVLFSQAISNVPAALLLSGFTTNYNGVLIGVNLGGLGTLIASMASLISYKILAKEMPEKKGFYFRQFTIYSILFLVALMLFYLFLG